MAARENADAETSQRALLLQRRVVSVATYATELRRGRRPTLDARGRRVAPVAVPLARGESEPQYEARFLAWLAERGVALADLAHDANRERSFRMSFAERVAKDYEQSTSRPDDATPSVSSSSSASTRDSHAPKDVLVEATNVPRHLTLVHEYMSLGDFRRDASRGRFVRIGKLRYADKVKQFGSPYAPIYVPLAPGETPELYEKRFIKWLETCQRMTLSELENHKIHIQERFMRMQFAALNAKGRERFEPERPPTPRSEPLKRERTQSDEERHDATTSPPIAKKAKEEESCPGKDSVEACRACGCRRCLLEAMRLLATAVLTLESKAGSSRCPCLGESSPTDIMDLTIGANKSTQQPESRVSVPGQITVEDMDEVEQKLLSEYETQNELIVMNENALEEATVELTELVSTDIVEATRRREEDDEMRELLQEEIEKRNAALAMLLVYMHRRNVCALEQMIESPQANDVAHIQRLGHRKCMQLATEIFETKARLTGIGKQAVGRSDLEAKLRQLEETRRTELVTLVYFDQRVRELIRGWLARIESHG